MILRGRGEQRPYTIPIHTDRAYPLPPACFAHEYQSSLFASRTILRDAFVLCSVDIPVCVPM